MSTNQVEKFLNLFMVAWQVARIYELKHPKFKIVLDEAHEMLSVLLGQSQELIIGL